MEDCPFDTAATRSTTEIGPSAQEFLDHLGLPRRNPLCDPNFDDSPSVDERLASFARGVFEIPAVSNSSSPNASVESIRAALVQPSTPRVGPVSMMDLHDGSWRDLLITATTMSAPTLAVGELWLRFFAVFLCPLCLAYMIQNEITRNKDSKTGWLATIIYTTGLASSAVLFTDSLYVFQYGRMFGLSMFLLSSVLAARCCMSKNASDGANLNRVQRLLQLATLAILAVTAVVYARSDGGVFMDSYIEGLLHWTSNPASDFDDPFDPLKHLPHPGLDTPTIEQGTYFSKSNEYVSDIVAHWPESSRSYEVEHPSGATPFLVSGDHRTGIPFLVNKIPDQEYVRVWTQNKFDGEYFALDIAFPYGSDGDRERVFVHDTNKPVFLVLHGLNGGSFEEYVQDLVMRERSKGSTAIVLIARGMMDTVVKGWNIFHGARTGDVDAAARAVRRGLESLAFSKQVPVRQTFSGVGFSMGAIVISNYVARSGAECALDSAMALSGGLDMRQMLNFKRSMRLWQPMLTFGLREDILLGKFARHIKHRLNKEQFLALLRTTHISALDAHAIVTYNGFTDLVHYYSEMSAMGDQEPEFGLFGGKAVVGDRNWGRIANVSVPFAVVQALDDPLTAWRTIGTEDPQALSDSGDGKIIVVLTKSGGHVGWPMGNNPREKAWLWMSTIAGTFTASVDAVRMKTHREVAESS